MVILHVMIAETHGRFWFEHTVKFHQHFFLIIEFMKYIKEDNKIKAVIRKGCVTV